MQITKWDFVWPFLGFGIAYICVRTAIFAIYDQVDYTNSSTTFILLMLLAFIEIEWEQKDRKNEN